VAVHLAGGSVRPDESDLSSGTHLHSLVIVGYGKGFRLRDAHKV